MPQARMASFRSLRLLISLSNGVSGASAAIDSSGAGADSVDADAPDSEETSPLPLEEAASVLSGGDGALV